MQNKLSLRALLFWPHLVVGLTAGLIVFVLSVTGALLAFERPLLAAADARVLGKLTVTPTRLPLTQLVARVEQQAGQKVSSITVAADPQAPVALEAGRGRIYLADPYQGRIAGPASAGLRGFFEQVTGLHRWFGLSGASRKTVLLIKGWFTLGFVFLIASGWLLWLPAKFTPQALRVRLRPGWAATARAREFNWHHSFGLWFSIPLAAIALTGVIMALPWANALLFRVTGSPVPQQPARGGEPAGRGGKNSDAAKARGPMEQHGGHEGGEKPKGANGEGKTNAHSTPSIDYDRVFAAVSSEAAAHLDPNWRTLQLRLPEAGARTLQVVVDSGNGAQPARRDTVVLSLQGQIDHTERFTEQSLGKRARAIARFLHTGEVLGLAGETLAFLACLCSMLLVYTGVALSIRRFTR